MTDIATVVMPDGSLDWMMDGPDLASDNGLQTSIIISYFTDGLAEADDVIPDGTGDRRGSWVDLPLDAGAADDHIGSRLWLLQRALATTATALRGREYCIEALAWMIEDGVAADVAVTTRWRDLRFLEIDTVISQRAAGGAAINARFRAVWDATLGAPTEFTLLQAA